MMHYKQRDGAAPASSEGKRSGPSGDAGGEPLATAPSPTQLLAARMADYLLRGGGREVTSGQDDAQCSPLIPLPSRSKADRSLLLSFDYSPSTHCLVPFRVGAAPIGTAAVEAMTQRKRVCSSSSAESVDDRNAATARDGNTITTTTPALSSTLLPSDGVCPYLSAVIPMVGVERYIQRALDYCHCSPHTGVVALILMLRLTHSGPVVWDVEESSDTCSGQGSSTPPASPLATTSSSVEMELNALAPSNNADQQASLPLRAPATLVVPLSLWTFHRLFFSCFVLAAKWLEDKVYVMSYYAGVGGFPTWRELGGLEGETFRRLGFSLWPSEREWHLATKALGLDIPLAQPPSRPSAAAVSIAPPLVELVPTTPTPETAATVLSLAQASSDAATANSAIRSPALVTSEDEGQSDEESTSHSSPTAVCHHPTRAAAAHDDGPPSPRKAAALGGSLPRGGSSRTSLRGYYAGCGCSSSSSEDGPSLSPPTGRGAHSTDCWARSTSTRVGGLTRSNLGHCRADGTEEHDAPGLSCADAFAAARQF